MIRINKNILIYFNYQSSININNYLTIFNFKMLKINCFKILLKSDLKYLNNILIVSKNYKIGHKVLKRIFLITN